MIPSLKTLDASNYGSMHLTTELIFSGIGVHSGNKSTIKVYPNNINSGYLFIRTDVKHDRYINATYKNVTNTRMCTQIANDGGVSVATVEHLLAALSGVGIHDAIIEVDGPELPIMDGSAACFATDFSKFSRYSPTFFRKQIKIIKTVSVQLNNSFAYFMPKEYPEITVYYDGHGKMSSLLRSKIMSFNWENFTKEIAPARTFGFYEDAIRLRNAGLAMGASLDNTIVIKDDGILNKDQLRFKDEFLRHKILDVIGDLSLCEYEIIGQFIGINPNHTINNAILRSLFSNPDSYEIID